MSLNHHEETPRILVVDDDPASARELTDMLTDAFDVSVVSDAEAALRRTAEQPVPALILLAWQLRGTPAAALCQALRESPLTATIPVIFLTSDLDIDDEIQMLADDGAIDFIRRPLKKPVVVARIRMHLSLATKSQALKLRTEQLEALNQELESFSYSVSHDLRTPLRAIRGFSQALMEDCGDRLGAQGQDYLRRVMAAGQRMDELIVDLLALSRVSRSHFETDAVDLSRLVHNAADTLRQQHPHPDLTVTVEDNIEVQGDARLLRIAVENLLENAFKFTAHTAHARIEFGSRLEAGTTVYFIRDNGAGFDPCYADKLFAPFQRLHANTDYPGTGIGLATVQRVISRHGGRIWGTSDIGQGAEFCFTLPSS